MRNKQYFSHWQRLAATFVMFSGFVLGSQAALAQGNPTTGADKITNCVTCHGESGNEAVLPNTIIPSIGGQNEKYLLKQMIDIKAGTRQVNPLMQPTLNNLSEEDMADIAAYYSEQPAPAGAADPELAELGETIYRAGIADIGVAACTACHSPTGKGNISAGYPALSGQDVEYTASQLKAFRDGSRANDDAQVMRSTAARLSDAEINALASYVSGLR